MLPSTAKSIASHFMPPQATEVARNVDALYAFLLIVSFISCVLVIGGLIVFAIKYRRTPQNMKTPYISHNGTLEFLWSFIPFVIFMIVFVWGWAVYHQLRSMPEDALEVAVRMASISSCAAAVRHARSPSYCTQTSMRAWARLIVE